MPFHLLVHVEKIVDHLDALRRIVRAWKACFGIPLLSFSSKGPGQEIDDAFVKGHSNFGRLDNQISLKLMESRKRSACILEIWFTNPARAIHGDLNFISASLPDQWLAQCGPDKAEKSIVQFFLSFDGIGVLLDATFEHEDVAVQSPGFEVFKALRMAYHCGLGHVAYLNSQFQHAYGGLAALARAGFKVHAKWDHGCIAAIPLNYQPSTKEAAWRLFGALEQLGVFTRSSEPKLLEEHNISIEGIGGFLGAFEERFGRTFAARYSDGLRPAESA